MIGTTLVDIRDHIEALASVDGEYYVVCGRTGDRPVPISGLRFEGRTTAQSAARAAEQYRTAFRQYDPQFPYYDLIVCQDAGSRPRTERTTSRTQRNDWSLSEPVLNEAQPTREPERRQLVEFCHSVAAAVFETLSAAGYEAVETAVMDAYFDLAETVADPDDLCLCLLESMATELDARLDPAEQANVLAHAAGQLEPLPASDKPVTATLTRLQQLGLVGNYTRSPWSIDLNDGTRSIVVRLSEYALSPRNGRLPVLPVVLDLYRRQLDWPPSALDVVGAEDGWRVTLVFANEVEPTELASVPIRSEV